MFNSKDFMLAGGNNQDYFQKMAQMAQFNQMNVYNGTQQSKGQANIKAFQDAVSGLSAEEATALTQNDEFIVAKNSYEKGFMDFLSSKFAAEFLSTDAGEKASNHLLDTTKKVLEYVAVESKIKKEKVDKLLAYLEQNPDLLNQLENGSNK
jgi:hypothetical protein